MHDLPQVLYRLGALSAQRRRKMRGCRVLTDGEEGAHAPQPVPQPHTTACAPCLGNRSVGLCQRCARSFCASTTTCETHTSSPACACAERATRSPSSREGARAI